MRLTSVPSLGDAHAACSCSVSFSHRRNASRNGAQNPGSHSIPPTQEDLYGAYEAARVGGINLFDTAEVLYTLLCTGLHVSHKNLTLAAMLNGCWSVILMLECDSSTDIQDPAPGRPRTQHSEPKDFFDCRCTAIKA